MISSTTTESNDEPGDTTGTMLEILDEYAETINTAIETIKIFAQDIIEKLDELLDKFPDYYSPLRR